MSGSNTAGDSTREIKAVFVGDTGSGKTSLISTYLHGVPPDERRATLFENYYKDITFKDKRYRFFICDIGGHADLSRLERMSYLETDIFVVCVDYSNPSGLDRARRWVEELEDTGIPIFLCLTKQDMGERITEEAIAEFVGEYEAVAGVSKTTCRDRKTVKQFFTQLIDKAVFRGGNEEEGCCSSFFYCSR